MKKTSLKRIGRVGRANLEANKILKQRWIDRRQFTCEIKLEGCLNNWLLQNCHRRKRWEYKGKVEELTKDSEVMLACQSCHNLVENNKKLREEVFQRLR